MLASSRPARGAARALRALAGGALLGGCLRSGSDATQLAAREHGVEEAPLPPGGVAGSAGASGPDAGDTALDWGFERVAAPDLASDVPGCNFGSPIAAGPG